MNGMPAGGEGPVAEKQQAEKRNRAKPTICSTQEETQQGGLQHGWITKEDPTFIGDVGLSALVCTRPGTCPPLDGQTVEAKPERASWCSVRRV